MLVDVLHGEADLLIPMMLERGLPLHPALFDVNNGKKKPSSDSDTLSTGENKSGSAKKKRKTPNFILANKKLASLPPNRPRANKEMKEKLEREFRYAAGF